MFRYPKGFYVDVRVETVFESSIQLTMGKIDDMKEKSYEAAFIRLFDGKRWYYASTSEIDSIQAEIDNLAAMASPDPYIDDNPIVGELEVNIGAYLEFSGDESVALATRAEKLAVLKEYTEIVAGCEFVKMFRSNYIDRKVVKKIFSSKGTELEFDVQRVGLRVFYELVDGEKKFTDRFDMGSNYFGDMKGLADQVRERLDRSVSFLQSSVPVKPGKYPVILSPEAAGVFAHESFGHKSESDFMIGDAKMREEWKLGKKVGAEILSIVDDGNQKGQGYTPFDDEGTKARKTFLIKDGTLTGRLHSSQTAAILEESPTGNARSINFEFEPIVRMTTTYIKEGRKTLEELISEVDEGILVETINHGSGMSTFTLAPSMAYMIRDGKVAEPVKISVITGNVFETLNLIDGLSNELTLLSFAMGGCGKMEQYPLPVGFGGPYVRVSTMNVQ